MYLSKEHITAIIDLIDDGEFENAVDIWQEQSSAEGHCERCFYTPMAEEIRCFACLEGHLTSAVLAHSYPHLPHEDLELIEHMFKTWAQETLYKRPQP